MLSLLCFNHPVFQRTDNNARKRSENEAHVEIEFSKILIEFFATKCEIKVWPEASRVFTITKFLFAFTERKWGMFVERPIL